MTDLNKVIAGAKAIEKILTENFGGTGRGMTEKLQSSRYPIPAPLEKRVKHLAWLRNRAVHEEGFTLQNADAYELQCRAVCEELKRAHALAEQAAQFRGQSSSVKGIGIALITIFVVVGTVFVYSSIPRGKEGQEKKDSFSVIENASFLASNPDASTSLSSPPAVEVAMPASREPANMFGESRTETAVSKGLEKRDAKPASRPVPATQQLPLGSHFALGNDVITIEALNVKFVRGAFNRFEPKISAAFTNTSDRTISSLNMQARLYINKESVPVFDGSALNSRGPFFFISFGNEGLAPGETRSQIFHNPSHFDWGMPDVVSARNYQLVLRLTKVEDGRRSEFGGPAAAWPEVQGEVESGPLSAGKAMPVDDLRKVFQSGQHLASFDDRFEIKDITIVMSKDSFGNAIPRISFELINHSPVTLRYVTFEAQLFIKGEKTPVIHSTDSFRTMQATFGEGGLLSGKTKKLSIEPSFHDRNNWSVPDVARAIREGKAQLILRIVNFQDGRGLSHSSNAPKFAEIM